MDIRRYCCCHKMTNSFMREKVATSELPGLMVLVGCAISLTHSLFLCWVWILILITFKCFALSLDLCALWYRSQTTTSSDPDLIYQFNRSKKNSELSHSARIIGSDGQPLSTNGALGSVTGTVLWFELVALVLSVRGLLVRLFVPALCTYFEVWLSV